MNFDVNIFVEVELSTSFTGICGTDIHFYGEGGIPPAFIIVDPIVPGHEASGVVTKLGQGVTNLKIGQYNYILSFNENMHTY